MIENFYFFHVTKLLATSRLQLETLNPRENYIDVILLHSPASS